MSEKLISIILPCYNVEQYLDRSFNSLKNQTLGFENMELIFVNDASKDGTLDKLTSLEEKYPDNIIVINNGKIERIGKHDDLMKNCALYKNMSDANDRRDNWSMKTRSIA